MSEEIIQPHQRLAEDLLVGAPAIAAELGVDVHAVYYIFKKRRLPIGKLGKNLIASRSGLRRAAKALTSAA